MSAHEEPDLIIRLVGHRPLAGELAIADLHRLVEHLESAIRSLAMPVIEPLPTGKLPPIPLPRLVITDLQLLEHELLLSTHVQPDGRECRPLPEIVEEILACEMKPEKTGPCSGNSHLRRIQYELPRAVETCFLRWLPTDATLELSRVKPPPFKWPDPRGLPTPDPELIRLALESA